MSWTDLSSIVTWGGLLTVLGMVFALGAAPVLVVRLLALLYPKAHPRRRELVAEMEHVAGLKKSLDRWYWLGEQFALAVLQGPRARLAQRTVAGVTVKARSHWLSDSVTVTRPSGRRERVAHSREMGDTIVWLDADADPLTEPEIEAVEKSLGMGPILVRRGSRTGAPRADRHA